jgi:WD40 repeat protein
VQIWDLTTSRCLVTLLRSDVMTDSRPVTVSGNGRLVVAGGLEEHAFLLEVPDPGPPAHWSFTRPRSFAELTTAEQAVVVAIRRADELRAADSPSAAADALRAARRVAGHERSPELLRRWRRLGPAGRRTSLRAAWRIRRIPGRGAWRETAEDSIAFSATAGGMLRVWDLDTGSLRHEMIGHQGRLAAVAISPDGAHGYTAGDDGYLRMWDLRSGTRTAELRTTLQSVEITRNGLVVGEDRMTGNLTVHDLPAGRRRWSWRPTGRSDSASLHRIGLAAEDLLAVTTNSDGTGQVWDLVAGRCVLMLTPRKGGISGITVDEKRGRVFTLDRQAGIRVWDLATGHRDRLLSCSGRQLNTLPIVVSPDGKLVLFCGDGPDVRVWDVQSGRCVRVLEGHSSFVQDVVVSGDGAAAVTSSYDGTARVWDMATGRCLRVLEHAGNMGVSASDDLHRVMTQVGDSDEMQLWELDWEYDFTSAPTPEPAPAPRPPGRWSRLLGR